MLKLLIVEDEPLTANGLINSIEWQEYGVNIIGTADDGEEAIRLIEKNKPDIVLTDIRMPGMDGLELAEWIRDRYPDIFIVFLTGYNEFEYARSAVRLEAVDFLLKPTDDEALFKVIKKIRSKVEKRQKNEKEQVRLQKILEQSMPVLREKFIHSLLNQEVGCEEIKYSNEFYNINLSGDLYLVALAEVDPEGSKKEDIKNLELLKIKLLDIIEDKLHITEKKFVFNDRNNIGLILCFDRLSSTEDLYNRILNMFESVRREVCMQSFVITIGVSKLQEGINSLHASYREAVKALDSKIWIGKNVVIPSGNISNLNSRIYVFSRSNLIRLVSSSDVEGVKNWLEGYFKYYRDNRGLNVKILQFIVFELVSILFETVNSEELLSENQFDFSIMEELNSCETLEELSERIFNLYLKIMDEIRTLKNKQSRKIIENIKKYIETNYMKDIGLKTISEKFYLNTSYVSKLFSNETGISFIGFLMKCRIEKAKSLLCDPRLKIYTISEMVGYGSEKYFTRVFKKYEGITPHEYRERHSIPAE